MNTELQQFVEELKAEKEKSESRLSTIENHDSINADILQQRINDFSFFIQALTKILNEGCVAAPADKQSEKPENNIGGLSDW